MKYQEKKVSVAELTSLIIKLALDTLWFHFKLMSHFQLYFGEELSQLSFTDTCLQSLKVLFVLF